LLKKGANLRKNKTLSLLRQQHAAYGLWLHSHHFHIARILAAQGLLDWLLLDMEHSPVDLSMSAMILATIADVSAGQCTPLARVSAGTIDKIKQALDAGAQGIIAPMVNTAQEAADIVRFSRYPPLGERGGGGLTPHLGFGLLNHAEYIPQANEEIMVGIQIETVEAVENIDAIVGVIDLDMIFIGPFDLHISLNLPPGLWSDAPLFQSAVAKVKAACQKANMPLGILTPNAEAARARQSEGFQFIGVGTDLAHLTNAVRSQFSHLKE
jgi:4-hydroxy-2-oxoheptanedioate aldolase